MPHVDSSSVRMISHLSNEGLITGETEIDDFGRQANAGYSKVLAAYARALEQRNRLLKEEGPDLALLDAWDKSVAVGGATLLRARIEALLSTDEEDLGCVSSISGGEVLKCSYESSLGDTSPNSPEMSLLTCLSAASLRPATLTCGVSRRRLDPNRDDIIFEIDGHDARVFGSQGQQRSVVLALKMSEVLLAAEILGEQPAPAP